jgi:hypothetical protein
MAKKTNDESIKNLLTALDNYHAAFPHGEFKSSMGIDANVLFPDGRKIDFGDALYHPENAAMAHFFCLCVGKWPEISSIIRKSLGTKKGK